MTISSNTQLFNSIISAHISKINTIKAYSLAQEYPTKENKVNRIIKIVFLICYILEKLFIYLYYEYI